LQTQEESIYGPTPGGYIRLAKGQELIQGCRPEIGLYDVNALEADLTKQGTAETEVIVFKRYF
jgi:hypothetical protein